MTRYTTIPVEVDAVQWFKHGDHEAVDAGQCYYWLNSEDQVCPGDWIVTLDGKHTVCKQADFDRRYRVEGGE